MLVLLRHLWLGLKLSFFARVRVTDWKATVGALMLLLAAIVAVTMMLDWLFLEPKPAVFNPLALREVFWPLPLLLFVGWLAAGRLSRESSAADSTSWPLLTPLALLAAWLFCELLSLGVRLIAQFNYPGLSIDEFSASMSSAVIVWQIVVALAWFRRVIRLSWISSALLSAPLACAIVWSAHYPSTRFWYASAEPTAEVSARADAIVQEEILELQSMLIHERLNGLAEQRPGVVDLYFVGFAPYAAQRVFSNEVGLVQQLMDQRFDTGERSIRLVNHSSTLRDHPLATVSNLRRAVLAVAEKMDRDEDVLMVYLTSHGTRSHRLVSELAPLELAALDPATLKSILEEARVRHRVLIVSACYSGGFIAPLRDANTLVMTSADVDRASFGCSDDATLTYFGRAVFDEQLRRTLSLTDAFDAAVPVIRERERQFDPLAPFSNPQLAIGDQIRLKLQALQVRLQAASALAAAR